ncbi:MAG: hypothetical protein DMF59_18285 [Acidobacteria bacterium]|nr:MAG: hypothetical protein DMF59_18285 [Acidobacteriota bacterium]
MDRSVKSEGNELFKLSDEKHNMLRSFAANQAESRKQKAEGDAEVVFTSAFCLLPSAFNVH